MSITDGQRLTMCTESNLNQSDNSRRSGLSWQTITAWLCLLWVGIAFCILFALFEKIDIKGIERSPYDLWFDCVGFTGLAAIPVGFGCGLWALLFRKDHGLPLPPTFLLGLLLMGLAFHQYREYQWWRQFRIDPPIVVPASLEPKENP